MVVHADNGTLLLFMRHGVRRHGDNRQPLEAGPPAQHPGGGQAVHDRHLDVHQHQVKGVRAALRQNFERLLTVDCHPRSNADHLEQGLDNLAVKYLIFDNEDRRIVIKHRRLATVRLRRGNIIDLTRFKTQPDAEDSALPGNTAHADFPAHHFNQILANGQTQAGAAIFAAHAGICLNKGLEQSTDLRFAHADAAIFNLDVQADFWLDTGLPANAEFNPTGCGEFDGVAQQIEENLLNAQRIADQGIVQGVVDLLDQLQAFFRRPEGDHRIAAMHNTAQTESIVFKLQIPCGDLREIQQIVDQAGEGLAGADHLVQLILLPRLGAAQPGQTGHADHRIERCAQLVTDVCEEGIFSLICNFGRIQCGAQVSSALRHLRFKLRLVPLSPGDVERGKDNPFANISRHQRRYRQKNADRLTALFAPAGFDNTHTITFNLRIAQLQNTLGLGRGLIKLRRRQPNDFFARITNQFAQRLVGFGNHPFDGDSDTHRRGAENHGNLALTFKQHNIPCLHRLGHLVDGKRQRRHFIAAILPAALVVVAGGQCAGSFLQVGKAARYQSIEQETKNKK